MRNELNAGCNPMKLKIEAWRKVNEKGTERLLIKKPEKSQRVLLMDLGEKEAADYYKYLCIPRTKLMTREEQVQEISKVLLKHPELKMWMKLPQEIVTNIIQVYGVIERNSLYQIYKKLYDNHMGKDDFLRIIYWHWPVSHLVKRILRKS